MVNRWFGRTLRYSVAAVTLLVLAACGGSDSSGGFLGAGPDPTPDDFILISITMVNENGDTISQVDSLNPGVLQIRVTDTGGNPSVDQVVRVSTTVGEIEPASGTGLTDSDGRVTFTLSAGGVQGAGTVTAAVETSAGDATATYNISASIRTFTVTPRLTDGNGNDLVTVDPLNEGVYTVTVTDPTGAPAQGLIVVASADIGTLLPSNGQAITNAAGVASFVVQTGDASGGGTLTATVDLPDDTTGTADLNFEVSTELPYILEISLEDENGFTITAGETSQLIQLNVRVLDSLDGDPIPGQVVSADIGTLGVLTPSGGNALTDANGRAIFEIEIGQETGALPITVAAVLPGGSVSEQINFSVAQAQRRLGFFTDTGVFRRGQIDIEPGDELSPGGTAALTVAVVDDTTTRTRTEETVSITSECLFAGRAVLDPPSPVTFTSQTTVSYTVSGCSGEDDITATLESDRRETAFGTVRIADLVAERISFTSAEPEIIALRDTGNSSTLSEGSLVSFTVTNLSGSPVTDVRVNFELSTTTGGVALTCDNDPICEYQNADEQAQDRSLTATDRSGLDGVATVELRSGFVATPVRVLAYVDLNENLQRDANEPQTASTALVITTGLADQDSVSLSASPLNVQGGYDTDGVTSTLTVRMADKFNNPVPDGTQAVFTTEYGSIVGSCTLANGACSVDWTSQAPRDSSFADPILITDVDDYFCPSHNEASGPCPDDIAIQIGPEPGPGDDVLAYARGGRSTILVTAIGEESFVDSNGNGLFDPGEAFIDLPEAFRDENEDGQHTPTACAGATPPLDAVCESGFDEDFIDFDLNGEYSFGNGLYNGVLCQRADDQSGACSRDLVNVRAQTVLVLGFRSAGAYDLLVIDGSTGDEPCLPSQVQKATMGNDNLTVRPGQSCDIVDDGIPYRLYVADIFNNPPPPGTEISFEGRGRCDINTPAPTIGDTSAPGAFTLSFSVATADGEDATADPDEVSLLLTLPNGSTTVTTYPCLVVGAAAGP